MRQAVDANFNTLRIWGGGYYPDSCFYDYCDQYGILVWQDFMVACANIYLTEEMAREFTEEAACNLKRLHHHASLGLLCGNNEMESGVLNWGARDNQLVRDDYTRLYGHLLPELCERYAPDTSIGPPARPPAAALMIRTTPPRAIPITGRSGTAACPLPPTAKRTSGSAPSTAL